MEQNRPSDGVYTQFKKACRERGTTISTVLKACGRSDGNTGAWKKGTYPRLDIAMDIAEYLGMSLDELCYSDSSHTVILDDNQREWLSIIKRIPEDKQQLCKDFIQTHAAAPVKYDPELGEKIS